MNAELVFEQSSHSAHNSIWIFPTVDDHSRICIACVVELCINSQSTSVNKHRIISELLATFEKHRQSAKILLENNLSAAFQILTILFELILENKNHLSAVGCEGIVVVLSIVNIEQLNESIFFRILEWFEKPGYNEALHLTLMQLLSNLLCLFPALQQHINQHFQPLIENICKRLDFSDINTKKTSLNLIFQVLKQNSIKCCSLNTTTTIAKHTVKTLESQDDKNLNYIAMAILRIIINDEFSKRIIFHCGSDESTLPMMFKKKLLLKDYVLQLSCVQCMTILIQQKANEEFLHRLLENDVVEILFELLDSEDKNLVSSILCCLRSLMEDFLFFEKHHSLFGFDPILRTVERFLEVKENHCLGYCFSLLNQIFQKHSSNISLFSSIQISKRTIKVLIKGVKNIHRKISNEAVLTAKYLFQNNHIHLLQVTPDVLELIKCSFEDLDKLFYIGKKADCQFLSKSFKSDYIEKTAAQNDRSFEAKLSLLWVICQNVSSLCQSSSYVASNEQINQIDFERTSTLIKQLICEVEENVLPVILKNRNAVQDNVFTLLLNSLCCLMNLSPEFRLRFSFRTAQTGITQLVWELKVKNELEVLTDISNEFLFTILYTLIVETNLIKDHQKIFCLIKTGLKYLHGDIEESSAIFNNFYVDNDTVLPQQETLLSVLYFTYLFIERPVTHEFMYNLMIFSFNKQEFQKLQNFSQKHLLFLFATIDLELHNEGKDPSHNDEIADFIHCRKCLISYIQSSCNLEALYTHHVNLLRWTFLTQEIADVFADSVVKGWIQSMVFKTSDGFDINDEEMEAFLMVCSKSTFCLTRLLAILPSQTEEFQNKVVIFFNSLMRDEVNGVTENKIPITSEIKRHFPDLLQEFKNSRDLTVMLLKLLCHFCNISTTGICENADVKMFSIICTMLNTAEDDVCLFWYLQYLNTVLHQALAINEIKFFGLLATDKTALPKTIELLSCVESDLQINCLDLLSVIIHYQIMFNIQPCKFIPLDFHNLYRLLFSNSPDVILAAVHLFSLLFKVSFNSIIRIKFHPESNSRNCYEINSVSLRSLYITLQNIALKSFSLQEATIQCLQKLLTFVQNSETLKKHDYFMQPWITIVFYTNIMKMLDDINCDEVKLLLVFVSSNSYNESLGSFLAKFISLILGEKCSSLDQDDFKLYLPLLKKILHSVYLKVIPKLLQEKIKEKTTSFDSSRMPTEKETTNKI